ncbi:MAG: hypothetical protein CSA11_02940 [Chloroflexi bacterium]|nr:MAG: hypothetical protein CSA11_02940 [Chloroflexota bacterium]
MTLSKISQEQQGWQRYIPLLIPFAIYLAFLFVLIRAVNIAQYDESIYLDVARNIRRTGLPIRSVGEKGFLLLDQTPLYPYMLAGLGLIFGENLLIFRLVTAFSGIGTIGAAYKIALQIRGPISGLAAALLLAVNPFFILLSYFIRMELFLCFFLLWATYFLIKWDQTKRKRFLLSSGLAIAAATLFKVVAVLFCGAAVIYVFLQKNRWRTRLSLSFWLGIPTALGVVLWISMMFLDLDRLQVRLARWTGALGGESKIVDPRLGIATGPWLQAIGENLLGWGLVLIFVVALLVFLSGRQGRPPIVWVLLLYQLLVITTSLIMKLKEQRHVIGLIPVTAVAIGLMINWDNVWLWLKKHRVWLGVVIIFTIIFLWASSPLNFPQRYENSAEWWHPVIAGRLYHNDANLSPLVEAGSYLKQHSEPGEVIIVTRQGPVVGYYADRPYIFLYTRTFAENMNLLENANFLVMDSQEFWQQSAEETAQILQYIDQNFEVAYPVNPNVIVYRRLNP